VTDLIHAPWTSEQVAALEQFQTASAMHPFTCGAERHTLAPRLVPSHSGWYCPDRDCDYRQDWAHAFMVECGASRRATRSGLDKPLIFWLGVMWVLVFVILCGTPHVLRNATGWQTVEWILGLVGGCAVTVSLTAMTIRTQRRNR